MFKKGTIVLCTGDWDANNTEGKLGIILDTWGSDFLMGFFVELNKTNGSLGLYKEKYDSIESTWWVRGYLLRKVMTKNKFK